MRYVLASTLNTTTEFLQQVFLYSSAMRCFDQSIRTILSFIPGNVIALKGDFLGRGSVRTQARPCYLLSIHAEYDNLVLLYSK